MEVLPELRLLSDASWRGSGSFPKRKAVKATVVEGTMKLRDLMDGQKSP